MQPYTAVPRSAFTEQQVIDLLWNNPTMEIDYGAEYLDTTMTVLGDISDFMNPGSSIIHDCTADIAGGCSLNITDGSDFNYLQHYIKPYMTITDPQQGITCRFNLGVYLLTTPDHDYSVIPAIRAYSGYDLISILNQPIGDSLSFAAGDDPITDALAVIDDQLPSAIVNFTDTTLTIPSNLTFVASENNVTYLQVINELLSLAGYYPLYTDWDGIFQIQPFVLPSDQVIDLTFNVSDPNNIVAESPRVASQDLFDVPNWWRFYMQNLTSSPVEGVTQFTFENDDGTDPTSVLSRGGLFSRRIYSVNAADYPSLVTVAVQQINQDHFAAEQFALQISLLPVLWQYDKIVYQDQNLATIEPALSTTRVTLVANWTLPLDGSDYMGVTLQTILV